jgi:pyruvate carboxylase subunit B
MAVGDQEVITCRPADLISDELDKLRAEIEGLAKIRRRRADLCHVPGLGRTFLQERAAGTLTPEPLLPPEAKEAGGLPDHVRAQRIQRHPARRDLPHPHQGHRPRRRQASGRSMSMWTASPKKSCWKPSTRSKSRRALARRARSGGKKASGDTPGKQRPRPTHAGCVTTAMPGTIVDVKVKPGDKVKAGDGVLVIEAMKMENEVQAPVAAPSSASFVVKGDAVTPDQALVEIQPE